MGGPLQYRETIRRLAGRTHAEQDAWEQGYEYGLKHMTGTDVIWLLIAMVVCFVVGLLVGVL